MERQFQLKLQTHEIDGVVLRCVGNGVGLTMLRLQYDQTPPICFVAMLT